MSYINISSIPDMANPLDMVSWTNTHMEISLFPPICLTAIFIMFMVFKGFGVSSLRAIFSSMLITTIVFGFPFWLLGWLAWYYFMVGVILSAVLFVAVYYTDK